MSAVILGEQTVIVRCNTKSGWATPNTGAVASLKGAIGFGKKGKYGQKPKPHLAWNRNMVVEAGLAVA